MYKVLQKISKFIFVLENQYKINLILFTKDGGEKP